MAMVAESGNGGSSWQKRCVALESQLYRFRLQAGKIRELLAEKMQELEQRVIEADQRAETAEKQVQALREKLKAASIHTSESENGLLRRYHEVTNTLQEKDDMIQRLEQQLDKQNKLRGQEAKIIEEKAARIKEWVTLKLRELEFENYHLKVTSRKQAEEIQALQEKIQDLQGKRPVTGVTEVSGSPPAPPAPQAPTPPGKPDQAARPPPEDKKELCQEGSEPAAEGSPAGEAGRCVCSLTPAASGPDVWDHGGESQQSAGNPESGGVRLEHARPQRVAKEVLRAAPDAQSGSAPPPAVQKEASCEEHTVFRRQRLDSSSETNGPDLHLPARPPPLLSLLPSPRPKAAAPAPLSLATREGSAGTSMTLPKVRTPLVPRDSIQLAKKHCSQPQAGAERPNHIVSIDIPPFKPAAVPPPPVQLQETDIDDVSEQMETDEWAPAAIHDSSRFPLEAPGSDCSRRVSTTSRPPPPPLHRFPSWEGRIYALAKSGMRMSDVTLGANPSKRLSNLPAGITSGSFTQLIYKNVTVPVYTTLKGKATQISNIPFPDESSGSDDDSSSQASFRTSTAGSESRKTNGPGSPRAVKRGVSMSSVSSESDYAIPPDACSVDSDYSEPEHKLLRTCSIYSAESNCNEPLEKSGYLLKMGGRVRTWKRRWFTLRNSEILYYKSPSDVIRKPQGQIELGSSCRIVRGEGAQTFQLVTESRTYYLTADSPNILEEWIRVLQNILKVQLASPPGSRAEWKPTVRGWLTKVRHGYSKLVWCSLIGKVFYYFRNQDDKFPLGQLKVREAKVEEVDRSCDSDEDYEAGGRGFLSSHFTLVIHPKDQSPTYLLIGTKQEKDTWLYHLTVAAGSSHSKVGTEYEQLIGRLLDVDGQSGECHAGRLWINAGPGAGPGWYGARGLPINAPEKHQYPICDVISKWEQALKELHPGKYESNRIVRLMYKSRLYFRAQAKGETERERLLLAYQLNEEVVNSRFPISKDLALEVAALMAQVEYGDLARPAPSSPGGSSQSKNQQFLQQVLEKFYPKHYRQACTPEQLKRLCDRLATKWILLGGCSGADCVRIYLTVGRKWPLFGAKLFTARPIAPSPLEEKPVWLAVNEDGMNILESSTMHLVFSYPYLSIMTFGGYRDDFMIVLSKPKDESTAKTTVEKLVFAMAKSKILELTLILASYINHSSCHPLAISSSSPPTTLSSKKLWEIDSKHFPSMTRTTQGPTLL
ncbi:pleckstrin homology domain-containing family H member 1-like [Mobula hypostoma]|uniref:pleckstrin homology domain-containing family H member 1-like n=1 Tax=Mobula hypostoma TaxID=723540 RepID=UPI002FC31EE5